MKTTQGKAKFFTIEVDHGGRTFYLRSTVWTSEFDRATRHESFDKALDALKKAKPFMKRSVWMKAVPTPHE